MTTMLPMSVSRVDRSVVRTALLMDFLITAEKRDRRMVHLPMGRFGEAIEVAKGALFSEYPLVSFQSHV